MQRMQCGLIFGNERCDGTTTRTIAAREVDPLDPEPFARVPICEGHRMQMRRDVDLRPLRAYSRESVSA